MYRMPEAERLQRARQWGEDHQVVRSKMEAIARTRFWTDRGLREDIAVQLAELLTLTPETLAREAERFDPLLPTRSLRMLDVAKRLCREHNIPFPVLS